MSLESLINIVPPPEGAHKAGSDNSWEAVENSLGTPLPTDYKGFINSYGTGELAGSLWIYSPFSDVSRGQNLLVRASEVLDAWKAKRARYGRVEYPYPLYPEPKGLLPWGHVDTGAELFWLTTGKPEQWTVVVGEARGTEFEEFHGSMTEFLADLLIGKFESHILPKPPNRHAIHFFPTIG